MSRKWVLFKEIRVSFHPTLDVIWSSYNRSLYMHNSILYRLIVGVRHVNSFDWDDNVACIFNASVACRDKGFWVLRQELGYWFRRIGLPRKRVPNGIMMATTSPKKHSFSFCHLDRRRKNDENVYYRSFSNGSHWPFQRCSGRSHISIRRALFCRNAIVNHGHTHADQCHRTSSRRFGVKARWLLQFRRSSMWRNTGEYSSIATYQRCQHLPRMWWSNENYAVQQRQAQRLEERFLFDDHRRIVHRLARNHRFVQ